MCKISLCIPMYNESLIISDTVKAVSEYMSKNFDKYEIIFADDGSNDKSGEIAEATAGLINDPNIKIVGYRNNLGKGAAVRTAVMASNGDIVIFTDSDLAYGLDVVRRAVKEFEIHPEVELVIGSRNLDKSGYEGYTFIRKLASKTYIKVIAISAGFPLSDSQCGFKAFRGDTGRKFFSKCTTDGFAFDLEILMRVQKNGFKIHEMPVKVINHRDSKVSVVRDTLRMLEDVKKIKIKLKNEK